MGTSPILSPIEMPSTLFRIRVRRIAVGKDREKRIVSTENASSSFLDFCALLPRRKDPTASRMSQLARMMPMQSSLPEKTIKSSLRRSTSATTPLNPIATIARQTRCFTNLSHQRGQRRGCNEARMKCLHSTTDRRGFAIRGTPSSTGLVPTDGGVPLKAKPNLEKP